MSLIFGAPQTVAAFCRLFGVLLVSGKDVRPFFALIVFQPSGGKAQEALQLGIQDLLTAEGRVLQLSHSLSEEGLQHGDAITATGLKNGDWTGLFWSVYPCWIFVASMQYQPHNTIHVIA